MGMRREGSWGGVIVSEPNDIVLQKRFPVRAFFADFALATGSCNPKLTNCKAELVDCNPKTRYNEGTKTQVRCDYDFS